MKIEMNFSDAEIELLISEVHSKRKILFSSVHTGVSGLKKRKLGSTLQMLLMQFNLLIEQSWKLKGKWFDMKIDCKKRITLFQQNRIQTGGPPSSSSVSMNSSSV